MTSTQKRIFLLTLLLALGVFILFIPPNAAGSENRAMVLMFEPDEANTLPYVYKMLATAYSLKQALYQFAFYGFYNYGFPFFALSGLTVLPLKLAGQADNLPLVMLSLRQVVSVLPLLAGLLVLVGMQDGFRTYRSPLLFLFLASVPAVLGNNFWWHPDGLVFLLAALTLFFLWRDRLRFCWNFLAAAVFCGLATAVKLMGVYFFLAVGLALVLGAVLRKASWKRLVLAGGAFLAIMTAAYVGGNPYLISASARLRYFRTLASQAGLVSQGYEVVYEKGLAAAWGTMHVYYGEAVFLLLALGACIWMALRGKDRLLGALILAWFLPVTVAVIWITHFKFQYWLPAALPLFSCLAGALPERLSWPWNFKAIRPALARAVFMLVIGAQMVLFLNADVARYSSRLHRADNNPRILFYQRAVKTLGPVQQDLRVYYDARLYLPDTPRWQVNTTTDLLDYAYIAGNYDVLLLLQQRIYDYTQAGVTGIDPVQFALNQAFYRDANAGAIAGFHLVYRNDVGLIFVSEDLYQKYFH